MKLNITITPEEACKHISEHFKQQYPTDYTVNVSIEQAQPSIKDVNIPSLCRLVMYAFDNLQNVNKHSNGRPPLIDCKRVVEKFVDDMRKTVY